MLGMLLGGIDDEGQNTFTKSIENTKYFMWNSRNVTSTLYSLGDPELGDKFIIKVGADKRFGTPVFSLQGGRSSCPGEALTVWREQGMEMSLSTMPFNKYFDPNERAVLRLIVDNGTPYREASLYGLRIVDGLSESVNAVISAAHDALFLDGATGATVSQAINETAAKTIAKNSDVMQNIISDAALQRAKTRTHLPLSSLSPYRQLDRPLQTASKCLMSNLRSTAKFSTHFKVSCRSSTSTMMT